MSAPDTETLAPEDTESRDAATAADESTPSADEPAAGPAPRRVRWGRVVAFGIVPALTLLLAVAAGYLKYQFSTVTDSQTAAISSVQAATDGSIALLSYAPDTAQATLTAARDRLTGTFRDDYTKLTNDVVIPGSKQKKISATATVPAASSMSASENHAVVLVFVDQTVIVGNDAPSATASAVQVTLDKVDNHWLISGFDPK